MVYNKIITNYYQTNFLSSKSIRLLSGLFEIVKKSPSDEEGMNEISLV